MQVKYKDIIIDVKKGTKVNELLANKIEERHLEPIACRFNNEIKRLDMEIQEDGEIDLIDITNKDGMRVYIRGLVYIVCMAFRELYPNAKLTINYQLYHAMFCTVEDAPMTKETLKQVEKKVNEIIARNIPITKKTISKKEAIEFYNGNNEVRGKLQLETSNRDILTLYYCENYFNYLYGVMPLSTGCISQYELVKYDDGFLIRYPSRKQPEVLPELKDTTKLYNALKENAQTHKILDIYTLDKLNNVVRK